MRKLVRKHITISLLFLVPSQGFGQSPSAKPHFEVNSVRPRSASDFGPRTYCVGDRFVFGGRPLVDAVKWAYDLPINRIEGLPAWVSGSDTIYEIQAKASLKPDDATCSKAIVRSLLEERFEHVATLQPRGGISTS